MADQKISELTALTGANAADDDALAIVDTSAVETKKITRSELFTDTPTLLVGKASANSATDGVQFISDGISAITRSSGEALRLTRNDDDGQVLRFQKDGATVGSIGTEVADTTLQADLYIHGRSSVGSASENNSRLWLLGGDSGIVLDGHTNAILPTDENSYEDARTDIGSADYRFKDLYLSGGVVFDAVAGNATSNTLDDYEEGTWTVNMYDATSGGNESSTEVTGRYTKIGQQVIASFDAFNNVSTSGLTAGNAVYFTLPFAATSTGRSIGSVQLDSVSFPNSGTMVTTSVADSQSRATLNTSGNGLTDFTVKVQDFNGTSSDVVTWTLSYRTSS